jgi:hypothetical protein
MIDAFDNIKNYKPTHKGIIFSFLQDVEAGTFNNRTEWGLQVRNKNEDIKTPRWAIVERVGPDVPTHIKEGSYVLIEQLMWTEAFKVNEVKKWATSHEKILATSDVEPTGLV